MRPKSTCARKKVVKVPTLVYKGCGNGKSFCFELVANKAALIEEERSISARVPVSLFVLLELSGDNFIFTDNCNIEEIPESPLLLNPVNQFQNMFEVCEDEFIITMSAAASVTLSKMRCPLTSANFSAVFFPQNLAKPNKVISFR